jgi:hypothetical protein
MRAKLILDRIIGLHSRRVRSFGSNTSMYSTNQPVVQRTNYALDVNVDGVSLGSRPSNKTVLPNGLKP